MLQHLYAALLCLYPRQFRAEFGEEMLAVFTQVTQSFSPGQTFRYCMRELTDLPGALLQQYRQRSVWALSAAGSFPNESARLEARFRREFYRRLSFHMMKAALLVMLLIVAVPVHGYLYTVYTIHQRAQEFGIYPSLDEAIQANKATIGSAIAKGPNGDSNNFIWGVATTKGSSFFIHTKDGWVYYPENFWFVFGFLEDWMKFYHLYGEGIDVGSKLPAT